MGVGRKIAIGVSGLVGIVVVGIAGTYLWAGSAASGKLADTYRVHDVAFPIPAPLTEADVSALRAERASHVRKGQDPLAGVDLNAVAIERAVKRGKHLVETLYPCTGCHGMDYGGGVMFESSLVGRFMGPNLTTGNGARTLSYTAADWDRIVRHGVKPGGKPAIMPANDFFEMSDRELADIVTFLRALPPVDRIIPPSTLGPLAKWHIASGEFVLSAASHPTKHEIAHAALPPEFLPDANFGKHLAQTCIGCHRKTLAGGPIAGGDPRWPPAANLTPAGLSGWTYEDFVGAMRKGIRKDGTALREPMSARPRFAEHMSDTELQALWAYLRTLPPQSSAP